ncbi:MAG: superoxide dismutase family protein [Paucibacter sp.]|nr:superoxide dismutase family protein [Roseateles sp.]
MPAIPRSRRLAPLLLISLCGVVHAAAAASIAIPRHLIDSQGANRPLGWVTVIESNFGLVFSPDLAGLPPGFHGFHVHENPSCAPGVRDGQTVAGLAAGGHFDPLGTERHGTPWGTGHLGDLPALVVDASGHANYPVLAPRLKLADLRARSLMVHINGDNHADHPMPLGGGGGRLACGVTPGAAEP